MGVGAAGEGGEVGLRIAVMVVVVDPFGSHW